MSLPAARQPCPRCGLRVAYYEWHEPHTKWLRPSLFLFGLCPASKSAGRHCVAHCVNCEAQWLESAPDAVV